MYSGDKAGDEPFVTYSDSSHGDCFDTGSVYCWLCDYGCR